MLLSTGCSGVQVATAIADTVGELVIVQRHPAHIIPNPQAHADVDPSERAAMEAIAFVVNWKRLQSLESQLGNMHGMVMKDEEYATKTGVFCRILVTGYELHFGRQFDIRGTDGKSLKQAFEPHPFCGCRP